MEEGNEEGIGIRDAGQLLLAVAVGSKNDVDAGHGQSQDDVILIRRMTNENDSTDLLLFAQCLYHFLSDLDSVGIGHTGRWHNCRFD